MAMRVLLIEDDELVRGAVEAFFKTKGFDVVAVDGVREAKRVLEAGPVPSVAVVDFELPDGTALDLLQVLRIDHPEVASIVLTGHGSIERAVESVKLGADHFVTKPPKLAALAALVEESGGAREEATRRQTTRVTARRSDPDPFLGTSRAIRVLADQARRVAASDAPILVLGPTGAGKGVLARWLHEHSPRSAQPFVDLNCAGFTREFLDSELFGHERGAFTGAVAAKPGLFEVAHRGTVFLDEIGDIDPGIQPKLLKVLEEKRFRRLGEVKDRTVDIRLIAATHHDLPKLVEEGRFRSDLYFRVAAVPLVVPPLSERPEDVPLLARRLINQVCAETSRAVVELEPAALSVLQDYEWPGNIRELRNVLERAILMADSGRIGPDDLFLVGRRANRRPAPAPVSASAAPAPAPAAPSETPAPAGPLPTLADLERAHVERVLVHTGWHVEQAARVLGVSRSALYDKLKAYGLSRPKG